MSPKAPKTVMTPEEVQIDVDQNDHVIINPNTDYVKSSKKSFTTQAVGKKEGNNEGHQRVGESTVCSCGYTAQTAHRLGKHTQKFNSDSRLRDACFDPENKYFFVMRYVEGKHHQVPVRIT